MYTNQYLQVKCLNYCSDMFKAQSEIKQGGVVSPVLFAFYMGGLFARLRDSVFVCNIDQHFVEGVGFADDLKCSCTICIK